MDDMLTESLSGFDELWQRVTRQDLVPEGRPRSGEARTYGREDALLTFIHDETCAAAGYAALARMFQGDSRAALLRHAAGARSHLRRLRAEYFIATGLTGGGNEDCRALSGRLASLRELFLRSEDLAARYARAAESAGDEALREAYAAFAQDVDRRAQDTRALLVDSF